MTDRQVLISAALGVGAICATVAGSSCSTNARIDDLQGNLVDVRDEIQSVRDEIRDEIRSVRDEMRDEIRSVRDEVRVQVRSVRDELEGVRGEIRDVRAEVRDVRDLLIDHLEDHDPVGPDD